MQEDLGRLVAKMIDGIVAEEAEQQVVHRSLSPEVQEVMDAPEDTSRVIVGLETLNDVNMEEEKPNFTFGHAGVEEDMGMDIDDGFDQNLRANLGTVDGNPRNGLPSDEEGQVLHPTKPFKRRKTGSSSTKPKEPHTLPDNSRRRAQRRQGKEAKEPLAEDPIDDEDLARHIMGALIDMPQELKQKLLTVPLHKLSKTLIDLTVDN
jgi:hypothetical protein